jgi:hypothetical protein
MKRRMLDLFCGGGLAGAGYWQSGCFSEIVGVDINPDFGYVYPFDFVAGDAIKLDYEFLLEFDFIHASPPCQFYSAITPKWARNRHPRLIPPVHLMLYATGKPYVIENVPGSGHDLRPNFFLSGLDVGLPLDRPRLFHIRDSPGLNMSTRQNTNMSSPAISQMIVEEISQIKSGLISQISPDRSFNVKRSGISQINIAENIQIKASAAPNMRGAAGANLSHVEIFNIHGDEYVSRDELIEAFGLRSLPVSHLRRVTAPHIIQGIPPAMTRKIAGMLFSKLMVR